MLPLLFGVFGLRVPCSAWLEILINPFMSVHAQGRIWAHGTYRDGMIQSIGVCTEHMVYGPTYISNVKAYATCISLVNSIKPILKFVVWTHSTMRPTVMEYR